MEGKSVYDEKGKEEKREGEKEHEESLKKETENLKIVKGREMWKSERRGSKWGKENESGCKNEMRKRLILEEGFQGKEERKMWRGRAGEEGSKRRR